MITGKNIILIGIEWAFHWQAAQEIASRFARAGNRIMYLENTGSRRPQWVDAPRVVARLSQWARRLRSGPLEIEHNLFVYAPLVLPPFGPAWERSANRFVFLPRVLAAASSLGMERFVVWSFVPTDTILDLVEASRDRLAGLAYYCATDFSIGGKSAIVHSEQQFVARSDVVFTNCNSLAERFRARHGSVHVVPPGVDLQAFPLERAGPSRLAGVPRPIIGYVGSVSRHIDMDLAVGLARARPNWSFVYVGDLEGEWSHLRDLPNVTMTGAVPHPQLASYVREFDVCTIPYARTPYTKTVVPTKLNEYLAMGKRVVSADLPALADSPNSAALVDAVPPTVDAFLTAIDRALETPVGTSEAARRREVASEAEWRVRFEQISLILRAHVPALR